LPGPSSKGCCAKSVVTLDPTQKGPGAREARTNCTRHAPAPCVQAHAHRLLMWVGIGVDCDMRNMAAHRPAPRTLQKCSSTPRRTQVRHSAAPACGLQWLWSINLCAVPTRLHRQICCTLSGTGSELRLSSHVTSHYISPILITIDSDLKGSLHHKPHHCHTANVAFSSRYQNPSGPVHSPVHRGAKRLRSYRAAGWWIL